MESPLLPREDGPVLHHWNILPSKSQRDKQNQKCSIDSIKSIRHQLSANENSMKWTITDIGKAGCLLTVPPTKVVFTDEEEMRRVYTLIYDVFRCKLRFNSFKFTIYSLRRVYCFSDKNVMMQALNDVNFYAENAKVGIIF